MILIEPSPLMKGRVRERLPEMPDHQRALFRTVLDGCSYAAVVQDEGAFTVPQGRPVVMVFGDDIDTSKGPDAFHLASLRRYLSRCGGVAVVSSGPSPTPYSTVAVLAIAARCDVAVIETLPTHEMAWLKIVGEAAPLSQVFICRPLPKDTAH